MSKLFKLILIFVFLGIAGCESEKDLKDQENASTIRWMKQELIYFKDPRTKLCFAAISANNSSKLTNVPCTPEVLDLIEKQN